MPHVVRPKRPAPDLKHCTFEVSNKLNSWRWKLIKRFHSWHAAHARISDYVYNKVPSHFIFCEKNKTISASHLETWWHEIRFCRVKVTEFYTSSWTVSLCWKCWEIILISFFILITPGVPNISASFLFFLKGTNTTPVR